MEQDELIGLMPHQQAENLWLEKYWHHRLENSRMVRYFDIVKETDEVKEGAYEKLNQNLPADLILTLDKLAPSDAAKQVFMIGILGLVAYEYSSLDEVVILNRLDRFDKELSNDPLPLGPTKVSGFRQKSFREVLTDLKQSLPRDAKNFLPEAMNYGRSIHGNITLLFTYNVEDRLPEELRSAVELSVEMTRNKISVEFLSSLYSKSFIARLTDRLVALAIMMGQADALNQNIKDIVSRKPGVDSFQVPSSFSHLFNELVTEIPECSAFAVAENNLSFANLMERVSKLEKVLRENNDTFMGKIAISPSSNVDFLVAVLAANKVGAEVVIPSQLLPQLQKEKVFRDCIAVIDSNEQIRNGIDLPKVLINEQFESRTHLKKGNANDSYRVVYPDHESSGKLEQWVQTVSAIVSEGLTKYPIGYHGSKASFGLLVWKTIVQLLTMKGSFGYSYPFDPNGTLEWAAIMRGGLKLPAICIADDHLTETQLFDRRTEHGITKAISKEKYVLSSPQKRMYFLNQLDSDSISYNICKILRLDGPLDLHAFESAFKQLVERHEILRTIFFTEEGEGYQRVLGADSFSVTYYEENHQSIQNRLDHIIRPFDLNKELAFRVSLIQLEDTNVLVLDMHHIIGDGLSYEVLSHEFFSLYQGFELPSVTLQYKDFAEWQQNWRYQIKIQKSKEYWLSEFSGEIPLLELPQDHKRPETMSSQGGWVDFKFDPTVSQKLYSLADEMKVTRFSIVLSLAYVWLHRLSNHEDIVIGTPVSGREIDGLQDNELASVIGMFVNTLALRNYPKSDTSFCHFLLEVHERTLKSFENQNYPYEDLVQELDLKRNRNRNPLFDFMLSYFVDGQDQQEAENSALQVSSFYEIESDQSMFDLTLNVRETKDQLECTLNFSRDLFETESIDRFQSYLTRIVEQVLDDPYQLIGEISFLSHDEEVRILQEFNAGFLKCTPEKSVIQLFEEQVMKAPNSIAVVYGSKYLTYQQLHDQSNQMAHFLRKKGIKKNPVVGIMLNKSLSLMVSLLGTMKAGAAYLPIDPQYPEERKAYLFENSECSYLLVDNKISGEVEFDGTVIDISDPDIYEQSTQNLGLTSTEDAALYVIYTSGSTGKPKGVIVGQQQFLSATFAWRSAYRLSDMPVNLLQMASLSFDVFAGDFSRTLLNGGKLVFCPDDLLLYPRSLHELIVQEEISVFESTPAVVFPLLNYIRQNSLPLSSLKLLIIGSDSCSKADFDKVVKAYGNEIRIVNSYGVTECTIDSSFYETTAAFADVTQTGYVPIGKPLPNTKFFILNGEKQPQPIGVAGELYIGGEGVALGYLNNAALTEERFIDSSILGMGRVYKTGDLARWLLDGNVEFLGRSDQQVKIRGFRIEFGEVETQLLHHPAITNAVVSVFESDGEKDLVAYFISRAELTPEELRTYLSQVLPNYMIPTYFVAIDNIPLSPNGKVDRKSLPKPVINLGDDYDAPETETEYTIISIWSEVLNLDQELISTTRGFFDMGGHSLKAMGLLNRISKHLDVNLSLSDLFDHQTVRSLAALIDQANKGNYVPITPVWKQHYSLSPAQRRMYFLHEFNPESLAYNMPQFARLEGPLERSRIEEIFNQLIIRHESLRTRFQLIEGEVYQQIDETVNFKIGFEECSFDELDDAINTFIQPFNLLHAPLIRVSLLRMAADDHMLLIDLNHIISDGVSTEILVRDFISLYNGLDLPELKLQYKDFSESLQTEAHKKLLSDHRAFWLDQFSDEVQVLNLPFDYRRPKTRSHEGSSLELKFEGAELEQLRALAREGEGTLYMVMLSIFNVWLSKLSNQEDIIVGTPTAGRDHPDVEDIVGIFVNTLALRNYPKGELNFMDFLFDVKVRTLESFRHQSYPYEELVDELNLVRDPSRNPLFDVMFSYQNYTEMSAELAGLKLSGYEYGKEQSKFDLTLTLQESKEHINLHFNYATELFTPESMTKLVGYFKSVVSEIIATPKCLLKDIKILSVEDENRQLITWNNSAVMYPDITVLDLFSKQAIEHPQKVALQLRSVSVSYQELDERAKKWANYLQSKGLQKDEVVGLLFTRSIEMIVAVLAVMKNGGAYVPINTSQPNARTVEMLQECEVSLLIHNEELDGGLKNTFKCLSSKELDESKTVSDQQEIQIINADLAYVIYTSGSTGKPKGVKVVHSSLSNYIQHQLDFYGIDEKDTILQFSPYYFDPSIEQIWLALCGGATLTLIEEDTLLNTREFIHYLEMIGVTHLHATPSFLATLCDYKVLGLRRVVSGGEVFRPSIMNSFQGEVKFYNKYGPTEATISTLEVEVEQNTKGVISLGRPIANTQVYVLGIHGELLPEGVTGELCLGGACLSVGYINNPEETEKYFVPNPFGKGKLYKTGDLVRWNKQGELEFVGRQDTQVKLRGYRIELGEIESQLNQLKGIKESVVVKDEDTEFLIAYYVAYLDQDTEELNKALSSSLPDYMIPSYFVQVDSIPLTANGKVDRRALPEPEFALSADYVGPSTETESRLVSIWSDLLGMVPDVISVDKSFFVLGGHSLKAISMVNYILKEFSVQILLRELYDHQTIRSLSSLIDSSSKEMYMPLALAPEQTHYILSPAQRRMYFLYEFDRQALTYNMPSIVKLEGKVDHVRLEDAFRKLIARHESLRTSFELIEGEVYQRIDDSSSSFEIEYRECAISEADAEIESFIRPFDLSQGPLMRACLLRLSPDDHLLVIDMHHIISDGVSMGLLIDDFIRFYNGDELPVLNLQYKDYSESLQSEVYKNQQSAHRDYWLDQFSDEVQVLDLPLDYRRPKVRNHEGSSLEIKFEGADFEQLRALALEGESTLYMVMLSIFNVWLSKLSNQEDIVVGTPTAGRDHPDLEEIVGMFVNTLALRNYPKGDLCFKDFLEDVKARTLESFTHQSYPYEELVDELNLVRDPSRNPLFDVMFSYQNYTEMSAELEGLELSGYEYGNEQSKFDLTLTVSESKDSLTLTFTYATDLFKAESMRRFVNYFEKVLQWSVNSPDQELKRVRILSSTEEKELLETLDHTGVGFPNEETLVSLFVAQAKRTPDVVALVYEEKELTYRQLDEESNQIAHQLNSHGIGNEDIVGLLMDRSSGIVISMLGIMKAGGAYLPIDVDFPEDRISYLLMDSGAKALLTIKESRIVPEYSGEVIYVEDALLCSKEPIANQPSPKDLCYIIYTSGTTGNPKGVMIEHRNVVRLLFNDGFQFKFDSSDVWTMFHGHTFDFSVWEMYGSLLYGGKLIVIPKMIARDPRSFRQLLQDKGVTVLNQTPGAFYNLMNEDMLLPSPGLHLRYVIFGGDALQPIKLKQWLERYPETKLVNMYGITETTVHVTSKLLSLSEIQNDIKTIGRPIPTLSVFILDPYQRLVPAGVVGELYIGGQGVGRGYLNRKELTSQRFIPHPYVAGERIYRSGDLGRLMSNGEIEYLGRADHQVKIRGFRIELGEIESQILRQDSISEVALVVQEEVGDKYLVAYFVSHTTAVENEQLRHSLSKKLPDYMIPSYFVQVDSIPLTANGKVDRRALPEPEFALSADYVGPSTETESRLVSIWSDLLGMVPDVISVDKNFFALGGHSLKAARLVNRIQKEFSVDFPLRQVFDSPTIHEMAQYMNKNPKNLTKHYNNVTLLNYTHYDHNLFMIHDVSGEPGAYLELSTLFPFTCFGVQFELEEDSFEQPSFVHLAQKYITQIREIQPKGPYNLLGWSIGGVIATEITSQLETNGEEVNLIVIDSVLTNDNSDENLGFDIKKEEQLIRDILKIDIKSECDSVFEIWETVKNNYLKDFTIKELKETCPQHIIDFFPEIRNKDTSEIIDGINVKRILLAAKQCYILDQQIQSRILYIKAQSSSSNLMIDSSKNKFQDFQSIELPGDHESIVQQPYVNKLSKVIIDFLKENLR